MRCEQSWYVGQKAGGGGVCGGVAERLDGGAGSRLGDAGQLATTDVEAGERLGAPDDHTIRDGVDGTAAWTAQRLLRKDSLPLYFWRHYWCGQRQLSTLVFSYQDGASWSEGATC